MMFSNRLPLSHLLSATQIKTLIFDSFAQVKKMPLFGKKKNGTNDLSTTHATISKNDQFDDSTSSSGSSNPSDVKMSKLKKKLTRQNSKSMVDEPTMEQLPGLIVDLETAEETSADRPTRALRMLFALSEHSDTDNRSKMVKEGSGRLVSVLLEFLERCSPKSSEQYLTLLVLNNISIPSENKRVSFIFKANGAGCLFVNET